MMIGNLVRLACLSLMVVCSGNVSHAQTADPIRPPTAPAHVRLNVPPESRKQFAAGFWHPALTALLDDRWTAKSDLASSVDGAKAVITYARVDKPSDLEDLKRPPDLTQTSVRRVSGNGWLGYIERNVDVDTGFEGIKMTITRAGTVMLVSLTWPAKSRACPLECDALIRNLVWTLAEKKEDKVD